MKRFIYQIHVPPDILREHGTCLETLALMPEINVRRRNHSNYVDISVVLETEVTTNIFELNYGSTCMKRPHEDAARYNLKSSNRDPSAISKSQS